ncbi:MAG: cadherin-like beta sandwich domain-containing protein [Gemmatimonadetes bacterium]|nr:cadherin-like beta sandwich domain-containing protein [Gemmatimonadota bacterium]
MNITETGDVISGTPPSTVTFKANESTATLTVATDDDDINEVASEVTAQIQTGTGYTVGTPASATVTVNDNDMPQVTITANTTSITEGMNATFTLTAHPRPATALTVNVNITETGDVISGIPPSTVTFSARQTTARLKVATDDDDVRESDGTVMAQITTGVGYTVGIPSSASINVNDNDTPPNSPATGAPIIIGKSELGETLTTDVSNIRDANGLTNVSYTYQWIRVIGSMETEIPGATGSTYEVVIADSGYQLKVRVNFTDDVGYPEELESALTEMIVIPGVTPVITITADPPSVTEGEAATFTITATPAPTITLTVNVNVTETAKTLSGTPPSTVTISAGQTTLTVATDDDKKDEHASVVTAQVRAGMGYVVGTPSSDRVLVLDDDLPPAMDATLSNLTINPGIMNPTFAPATLSYTALVPHDASSVTVTVTPNNPDATVSINGQNTTTLNIPFTGDTMDVTVTVTAVDGVTQLTYTITVNRAPAGLPQVTITANPTTVTEGTNATFTITANQPSVTDVNVNVNVTETAKMLSGTPPSTVTISAGHTTATLTVATEDDDVDEHASVVTAQVKVGTGYTIGDPSSASVLVLDDEVVLSTNAKLSSLTINPGTPNPAFDPDTYTYTATVPYATTTVTVTAIPSDIDATVTINGQTATSSNVPFTGDTMDITVTVTAEDNTTQVTYTITVNRGAPSTDATLSDLTINPGELNPAFDPATLDYTVSVENGISTITITATANHPGATITINGQTATTLDVSLVEGENTITVIVTAEDNITQLTYTITVNREAPVPQVTISTNITPVTEGTDATFTITATPAPTTALTVNVNVTETKNVISSTPPSTVTINANESTATLTVATEDDNTNENASVITSALQSGTGYTAGTPSSASVTVNDNDAAPNNPATGAPTITGTPEVGETLTADVSNIRDIDGLENVTYIYQWIRLVGSVETEISGATGVTYEVATADIGSRIKVRVNFTDDAGNAEELESELTSVVVAPVVPVLAITASTTPITEGAAATFTITVTPAPATALTVNVNITETGNVISGTPPATITISANQTTLTVATDDDNVDEEASAITTALQAGTGYTVGDPSSASVTVNDNDIPPNSPATGAPTISGTPRVGQTLTADVSNIQDANGLTNVSYTYQWIRLVGSVETEIIGATGVTYQITITDVDRQLKVRVNFTDDLGYAEELESAWTAVITPEEPRVIKLDGWLARFGRTASNHVIETVRERVRGHVGTNHVVIGGYNLDQMNYNGLSYNPAWMTGDSPMRFSIEAAQSDHDKEILKQIISSTSFALSGTLGPYSEPRWAVWGRGATTRFSGTDDDQTVEGDVTSVMLGIDYGDNSFQGGLVLSYSMGDGILGTIANTRDEWSVETTLTGIYPWARLALTNRFSVWGMLGYGGGDLPLSLEGIKQLETDANMVMGAIGTRTDLIGSTYHDGFSLSLASDMMLSRANADDLRDLLENKGTASRVRVLLEGSHVLWIAGGTLQPLAELGMRYDGGDADTGMGIEIGAGMRYVLSSLGLMIEGRVRGLIAHQEGSYEEWGGSGTIRLSPNPSGEGLSLRVSPTWGDASGSALALWSRPDMSDIASGRNSEVYASNRVSTEVAYGVPLGDKLVATPFVGLQNRHKRIGVGLHRDSLFGLAVEGMQHNRDLALRIRAGMHTQHIILRLEGSLDTYGHHAYFRLHHDMK